MRTLTGSATRSAARSTARSATRSTTHSATHSATRSATHSATHSAAQTGSVTQSRPVSRPVKITSADVAERAGVSQSAVSRVFTPGASASKKTAEKVRNAAEELGYRPNVLARAMVSGKSRIIGLVVSYLDNQFYPEALEKLSNSLQERGYHVLIFMAAKTTGSLDKVIAEILDYQVDGIIAASVDMSSELSKRCRASGVPIVLFNRSQDDPAVSVVTSDNEKSGRKVAQFLLAGGHKKIAYIAGWEGASTQRDREAGFTAALAEAGG